MENISYISIMSLNKESMYTMSVPSNSFFFKSGISIRYHLFF